MTVSEPWRHCLLHNPCMYVAGGDGIATLPCVAGCCAVQDLCTTLTTCCLPPSPLPHPSPPHLSPVAPRCRSTPCRRTITRTRALPWTGRACGRRGWRLATARSTSTCGSHKKGGAGRWGWAGAGGRAGGQWRVWRLGRSPAVGVPHRLTTPAACVPQVHLQAEWHGAGGLAQRLGWPAQLALLWSDPWHAAALCSAICCQDPLDQQYMSSTQQTTTLSPPCHHHPAPPPAHRSALCTTATPAAWRTCSGRPPRRACLPLAAWTTPSACGTPGSAPAPCWPSRGMTPTSTSSAGTGWSPTCWPAAGMMAR